MKHKKLKFGKFEKRFMRMMGKMFGTIVALIIILVWIGIPTLIIKITGGVMLVISFLVNKFYWNYLEGLELQEKMDKVVG